MKTRPTRGASRKTVKRAASKHSPPKLESLTDLRAWIRNNATPPETPGFWSVKAVDDAILWWYAVQEAEGYLDRCTVRTMAQLLLNGCKPIDHAEVAQHLRETWTELVEIWSPSAAYQELSGHLIRHFLDQPCA